MGDESGHFVVGTYLYIPGVGCFLENFHQMRSNGSAALGSVSAFNAAATHQANVAEVGSQTDEPVDGEWTVFNKASHQGGVVKIMSALHRVVVEEFF